MKTQFQVLDASDPTDRAAWLELWGAWPDREVQAHPTYVELFSGESDRALAAVAVDNAGARVLYPFLLREVTGTEPKLTDITSPYGYGGPFAWGAPNEALSVEFWIQFDDWAAKEHVVSEFVRFSLFPDELLPYPGRRILRQENIIVDLAQPADSLWMSFAHKVRKNVKRARRDGVTVEVRTDDVGFEDFYEIYLETMERRDASDSYLFPREFFQSIHSGLAGQYAYFYAYIGGRVVSAELVLASARSVYSFLGGTRSEYFAARPNDLLKFKVMEWARERGINNFVLGGGYVPGDGIEQYKKAFAPNGLAPFYTGQRILDLGAYTELAERSGNEKGVRENGSYFPIYRA